MKRNVDLQTSTERSSIDGEKWREDNRERVVVVVVVGARGVTAWDRGKPIDIRLVICCESSAVPALLAPGFVMNAALGPAQ